MFSKFLVTSVLVATCVGCGENRSSAFIESDGTAIVHGHAVRKNNELSKAIVGLIMVNGTKQELCTGTLLDDQTVLTAAHCLDDAPTKVFVIFDSNVKKASTEKIRPGDRFVQHPNWKKTATVGSGDLALIHFSGGMVEGYEPVHLANSRLKLATGMEVLLVGFGVTNGVRHLGAGLLRETKSTIVGMTAAHGIVTDGRTSSVCFGDSGGPGFVESEGDYVQWGVASAVANQPCNEASVHTNLIEYESWIKTQASRLRK